MKILYHHRTASKDGQAVHIEEMIAALRTLGHEVLVVAPTAGSGMGDKVGWVHRLKAVLPKFAYELLELTYSWVAYRKLRAAAREFQPDIIYERYNLFLMAGLMLKRRLKIPLLLEVNSPLVYERSQHSGGLSLARLARWSEGMVWRGADFVLPVTAVLADYVRAYGVPDIRIAVIPNGINQGHFASAPTNAVAKERLGLSGTLVLGFTGFIRDWHRVDRVIRWMATPAAPDNAVLLVVGDGPERPALEALAAAFGLGSRVRFTGVVPRAEVPAHVAAFDIALQPAVTPYASPLKLMEYLALGKPIVAPAEPNLLEVLTANVNALLFNDADEKDIHCALSILAGDPELRQRLGDGASATIERLQLTWLGNARRVIALANAAGASAS